MNKLIDFVGIEKVSPSIIMVTGVGGGGSNAVNHMFELGIAEVTFMVCNTDRQALYSSPVPIKLMLGEGLGAGNRPESARAAALESVDEIAAIFKQEGTRMVFITAGMGGGTGTGAAPIIAKAAKDMGILTVGIVTLPFKAEGPVRGRQAQEGIDQLKDCVDSLLIINNENIQEIYGKLPLTEAFGKADDILAMAAKGIAEIITRSGVINVDFADVRTVMSNSGIALMGAGRANGPDRAQKVTDMSLSSPLLNHNNISGARNILINITSGEDEITLDEAIRITDYIQDKAGNEANIIWGAGNDPALGDDIEITIIATGFDVRVLDTARAPRPQQQPAEPEAIPDAETAETEIAAPEAAGPATAPAAAPKPAWTPPAKELHPFEKQRLEATREQAETVVLQPHDNNHYPNLEDVENIPAYVRRKLQFDTQSTKSPQGKKEETPAPEKPAESSLFD